MTPTFAERLDAIIRTTTAPDGEPWSHRRIAAAIDDAGYPSISQGYLSQLRTGIKDNPTLHHILALAAVFHVDPAYFVSPRPSAEVEAMQEAAADRRREVAGLVARAVRLDERGIGALRAILDAVDTARPA